MGSAGMSLNARLEIPFIKIIIQDIERLERL